VNHSSRWQIDCNNYFHFFTLIFDSKLRAKVGLSRYHANVPAFNTIPDEGRDDHRAREANTYWPVIIQEIRSSSVDGFGNKKEASPTPTTGWHGACLGRQVPE
jgi:hypothetical protein